MSLTQFSSSEVTIVCVSDTHNDDCTQQMPPGDILIHAGDMTNNGTYEELKAAFNWISKLPYRVKVVIAGNHDLGLDTKHASFSQESLNLFTSEAAQAAGIHYLDRKTKTVAEYRGEDGVVRPIRVYGNPCTPDFLNSKYAFTYKPYPDESSIQAWTTAPATSENIDLWVMHSPPRHRLDAVHVPVLTGCTQQAIIIAQGRPLICVFGHYHLSRGVERVRWNAEGEVDEAILLSKEPGAQEFDFSEGTTLGPLQYGGETIFVNAAWMTAKGSSVSQRNAPFVLKLAPPAYDKIHGASL